MLAPAADHNSNNLAVVVAYRSIAGESGEAISVGQWRISRGSENQNRPVDRREAANEVDLPQILSGSSKDAKHDGSVGNTAGFRTV